MGKYNKLNQRKYAAYKVLRKINGNPYIVDLPNSMSISKTSNVSDVYTYYLQEEVLYPKSLWSISSQVKGNDAEHIDDMVEAFMDKWKNEKWGQKRPNLKWA